MRKVYGTENKPSFGFWQENSTKERSTEKAQQLWRFTYTKRKNRKSVVSLYYFCNSLFTLFQTINFGIDDTSSSDKTFSTASICCFARGWLRFIAMYYKTNFIQQYLVNTFTIFYLMSTTCTKSDDSAISSNVALKAATCRK